MLQTEIIDSPGKAYIRYEPCNVMFTDCHFIFVLTKVDVSEEETLRHSTTCFTRKTIL